MPAQALPEIVIVSGARTPMAEWVGGKRGDGLPGGALASVSAHRPGRGRRARAAIERAGVPAARIDHVVMGNALQTSGDAIYGARHVGAQGRRADRGTGADRQPPVRLGTPERRHRRADDPARRSELGAGRRHGEHEPGAARAARRAHAASSSGPTPALEDSLFVALKDSFCGLLHGADLRQPGAQVRHHARAAGRVRAPLPPARQRREHQRPLRRGAHRGRSEAVARRPRWSSWTITCSPSTSIEKLAATAGRRSAPNRW